MTSLLINHLRAATAFSLYLLNSFILVPLVIMIAIIKLILPFKKCHTPIRKLLTGIADLWIGINNANMNYLQNIEFDVTGLDDLRMDQWYLVVSNHQSWVDILILQKIFTRKIPLLKFFLKKELIWVPLMGLAWWALEFPFMKRYSKKYLEKKPHLKGKDIEITKKACRKFQSIPVSVVNFVEGTRYSESKHIKQQSPFNKLLKPKAGGVAFVLDSMGDMMNAVVNVTIVYPEGPKSFFQYLKGDLKKVRIHVEVLPITEQVIGDYANDASFRQSFQEWINQLWEQKDQQIGAMLSTEAD